ncbi:leucine-rich repeat-containing protein 28-like isoform X2 [Haliotis rufescens]|uniref:leucine-rich repeat-containing protein 28-like isoform X2 n=1 Tax=Haliotis rufescens TaxID=6454 RepID=UPI00201F07CE|nr:leucine-rich repeat-containing protein 28-like isoform X2 [Haliotis rufescens]
MTGILATENESLLHCMLPSLWIYHELLTEPGVAVGSSDRLFSLRTHMISDTAAVDGNPDDTIDLSPYKGDKVLQLNYKGLKNLPTVLTETEDFTHITNLYLKRNCLTTLPQGISLLQNLVVLYLHSNKLAALPNTIGDLSNLECLDVGANCLTCLPASIGRLAKLTSLKLAYNMVTHLPKSIGNLHQLVNLEAMNNRLRSLPLELFDCMNLEMLSVDSNQLHAIPRQICKLSRLKEISATGNNIVMLPQGMGASENLKSIFVDCNCYLSVLPIDLLKRHIGFYSETSNKSLPLPWEIRLVGNLTDACVPTLLELAMRCTHRVLTQTADVHYLEELPQMLVPLLSTPTAKCYKCQCSVFTMAFPMVFQSQLQGNSVYLLGLCCSVKCLRQCMFIINLPLVYPTLENLCLAVAII